ncbi:MAG: hypothetical protein WKF84_17160 [Pyrinomonadaceae bacterium]
MRSPRVQPHFRAESEARDLPVYARRTYLSVDTFDPKERLVRDHGKPLPIKRPLAFSDEAAGPLMKSPWEFKPGGTLRHACERSLSACARMR